jgi:hypothetical protein
MSIKKTLMKAPEMNRLPTAGKGKRFIVAFTNIMHLRRIYLLFKYEKA